MKPILEIIIIAILIFIGMLLFSNTKIYCVGSLQGKWIDNNCYWLDTKDGSYKLK